ncbi:MAG: hypothetical protein K2H06_01720, partial [Anaeroplasmataceae bacterium]|nr:hypothetical protein [Anaeroplasmataceae bacterium]
MEENIKFEQKSIEETKEILNTDSEKGLTAEEAEKRISLYGPNELQEKKKKSWFKIFLSELNNPMIFVLFAAIAVTLGLSIYETIVTLKANEPFDFLSTGDWPDVIIILAVIILNSVIGTTQELKAESS